MAILFVPFGVGFAYERREASRLWLLFSVGGRVCARLRVLPRPSGAGQGGRGSGATVTADPRRRRLSRDAPRDTAARSKSSGGWIKAVRRAYQVASLIRRIEQLEWRTEIGVGDAAATGLLTGLLWAAKSSVVAALASSHVFLSAPRLAVTPDFRSARLALEIRCIFRFSLGDIIVAALKRWSRRKRG